jgi:hypothetical protein
MKTLEELTAVINATSLDNKSAIIEAVTSLVGAEKQRGIESYRRKDADVLKLKSALKSLGYDKEDFDGVDQFVESLKLTKQKSTENQTEMEKLLARVEALQNENATTKAEREAERKKGERSTLSQKLSEALGSKLYASSAIIESLINNGVVKMVDGKMVFSTDTGDVSDFDAGIKHILDKNKDALKTEQRGGAGNPKGEDPYKGKTDISNMSASEIANNPEILKEYGL